MKRKFIVTGGGTSGHINPAITIADSLMAYYKAKGDECEIIFTGRKEGLEGELVPKAGYEMKYIEAKPFPMKPSMKMLKAIKALRIGRKQCDQIIKEFQPDAVIGTGGYVCGPLFMQANKLKIPVVIHEANAFPGRANKTFGRKAALVLTGFPNQENDFKGAGKIIHTGNPVRKQMLKGDYEQARKNLGIGPDEKLVFAMGGSLGAKTINDFIFEAAKRPEFKDVKFVLGTGKQQTKSIQDKEIPANLTIYEYIDNPQDYLSGADVSITRAGAVTCAETATIGSCSVLVPYPYAAHDHQTFNASAFANVGGCVLMADSDVVAGKLFDELDKLLKDDARRESIREKALSLAVYDCTDRIVNAIDGLFD
ncbi:MAG: undecaprenyldiphospho-muramoylpentapeptide beta-N-acetylglucosaminyltransferase [Saccharofermentans sp.]|nr:undecaprenyldiphospho-muramoylpentapeptide beta-N-acetylglucosaminyltransferase [Saccharofermentans sp.]